MLAASPISFLAVLYVVPGCVMVVHAVTRQSTASKGLITSVLFFILHPGMSGPIQLCFVRLRIWHVKSGTGVVPIIQPGHIREQTDYPHSIPGAQGDSFCSDGHQFCT